MRRPTPPAIAGIALAVCLLAGCAQPPVAPPLPPRAAAAIDANQRAGSYFRRGDFELAAQQYREALRLAQSIEDADTIAANAINLSVAYQRLGRHDDARAVLAASIDGSALSFSQSRLAQAALRRAVLDFEQKRGASAAEWLARAESQCTQGCAIAAAIHNLRGQLELGAGRFDAAAANAQLALAAARAGADPIETANALRLAGHAAIAGGNGGGAITSLNEALAIDHGLAQPHKILLDLTALGRAYALAGDTSAARGYFERALAVANAERDTTAASELRQLAAALPAGR